jgi:hypothetical protein
MNVIIVTPSDATTHLVETPVPGAATVLRIFQRCAAVDADFMVCGLNERQKLALIRHGVNTIAKLWLLGKDRSAIQTLAKPIVALPLNRGGCEFGLNIITALAALVRFYDDRRRLSLTLDPVAFGANELIEYEGKILNEDDGLSDSDDDEVEGPGKL